MAKDRVLVIDDEQLNLFLIQEFLDEEPLVLELQFDPMAAWWLLEAPGSDYSCLLYTSRCV